MIDGSVPPAAGLSSSSALVCASGLATLLSFEAALDKDAGNLHLFPLDRVLVIGSIVNFWSLSLCFVIARCFACAGSYAQHCSMYPYQRANTVAQPRRPPLPTCARRPRSTWARRAAAWTRRSRFSPSAARYSINVSMVAGGCSLLSLALALSLSLSLISRCHLHFSALRSLVLLCSRSVLSAIAPELRMYSNEPAAAASGHALSRSTCGSPRRAGQAYRVQPAAQRDGAPAARRSRALRRRQQLRPAQQGGHRALQPARRRDASRRQSLHFIFMPTCSVSVVLSWVNQYLEDCSLRVWLAAARQSARPRELARAASAESGAGAARQVARGDDSAGARRAQGGRVLARRALRPTRRARRHVRERVPHAQHSTRCAVCTLAPCALSPCPSPSPSLELLSARNIRIRCRIHVELSLLSCIVYRSLCVPVSVSV